MSYKRRKPTPEESIAALVACLAEKHVQFKEMGAKLADQQLVIDGYRRSDLPAEVYIPPSHYQRQIGERDAKIERQAACIAELERKLGERRQTISDVLRQCAVLASGLERPMANATFGEVCRRFDSAQDQLQRIRRELWVVGAPMSKPLAQDKPAAAEPAPKPEIPVGFSGFIVEFRNGGYYGGMLAEQSVSRDRAIIFKTAEEAEEIAEAYVVGGGMVVAR